MTRYKLPKYREGDWFAVPLASGGYSVGLAARALRGPAILGYFFGPRLTSVPNEEYMKALAPAEAVLIALFGDLGLVLEEWPIICSSVEWSRAAWPMQAFGRIDSVDSRVGYRITYNENRVIEAESIANVTPEEARRLPRDGVWGYGAVELYLDSLLA